MTLRTIDGIENKKLCLIMVTKNERDRCFLTQKLIRYMGWLAIKCKVFKDRDDLGRSIDIDDIITNICEWFREEYSTIAVLDIYDVNLCDGSQYSQSFKKHYIDTLFVEYIGDNPKSVNCDVINNTSVKPVSDTSDGIINNSRILNDQLSYVVLRKESKDTLINKVDNYLQTRIIFYILNINMENKSIWLSRHGESIYNLQEKIGGDSSLSPRGHKYAQLLPDLIKSQVGDLPLVVWTSTLKRTQETARFLPYKKLAWKALDELDAGVCDGMTYKEIEQAYPEDFKARDDDKYQYRYRGGESYADVVNRIEPVIMELERQDNVLIITHQAVLRCIYAYFMNVPQGESPWMTIPLHTLIKLTPTMDGVKVTRFKTDIPAVSTYKEKGSSDITDMPSTSSSKYANILEEASDIQNI